MEQIGRRIYYELSTGNILLHIGERQGDVRETTRYEDFSTFHQLKGIDQSSVGVINLAFGERADELKNVGSMKVENGQLIIYPRLTIASDKIRIDSGGIDTATITSDLAEYFTINDEGNYPVNPLLFSSIIPGSYIVTAHSILYGQSSLEIEVV